MTFGEHMSFEQRMAWAQRQDKFVKPIQTEYAGYRFRSRLEVRFAVAFDYHRWANPEVRWQYEPEGYKTPTTYGWYLPDFLLTYPGGALKFWEVKPETWRPNARDVDPVMSLVQKTGIGAIIARGLDGPTLWVEPLARTWQDLAPRCYLGDAAINAAKAARFEHGESPERPEWAV